MFSLINCEDPLPPKDSYGDSFKIIETPQRRALIGAGLADGLALDTELACVHMISWFRVRYSCHMPVSTIAEIPITNGRLRIPCRVRKLDFLFIPNPGTFIPRVNTLQSGDYHTLS